jgi:hypothetical protein
LERETRFELATLALARRCSTTELLPLRAALQLTFSFRGLWLDSLSGLATMRRTLAYYIHWIPLATQPRVYRAAQTGSNRGESCPGALFLAHHLPVTHVQDASRNRRRLRVMRDHQGGLAQLSV